MADYIEFKERLDRLNESLRRVQNIQDSLSDFPDRHRKFAEEININFAELKSIYESSKLNLMIDYYTFSEQLIKEFVLSILDIESAKQNKHLEKYLKNSFNRNTYSPKSEFKNIKEIIDKFIFIEKENDKVKLLLFNTDTDFKENHNSLIQARHKYAHNSSVPEFDISEYVEKSLPSLEFLLNEFINLDNYFKDRLEIQYLIVEIEKQYQALKRMNARDLNFKDKVRKFKKNLKKLAKCRNRIEISSAVYEIIFSEAAKFTMLDLRFSNKKLKEQIDEIKFSLKSAS